MTYPPDLFRVSAADTEPLRLDNPSPLTSRFLESLGPALERQRRELDAIGPEAEDGDDPLDRLYRHNHRLAGLTRLHGLDKAAHLLAVLDFAFDAARHVGTLKIHSIDYLAKLFYGKLQTLSVELAEGGTTETSTEDLLGEAAHYLNPVLTAWNARVATEQELPAEPEPDPSALAQPPAPPSAAPGFDDGPEVMAIPADKVGMISDFFEENSQVLAQFANQLVELEANGVSKALVDDMFRMMHTVKGGARMMNFRKMEVLAHALENQLDSLRQGSAPASPELIDLFFEGRGLLEAMLGEATSRGPFLTRIAPLVARLEGGTPVAPMAKPAPTAANPPAALTREGETLRVSSEKLDEVLNTASEIFIGRIRFQNEIARVGAYLKASQSVLDRAADFERQRLKARLDQHLPEFSKQLKRQTPDEDLGPLISGLVNRVLPQSEEGELSLHEELNLNHLTIETLHGHLQKNLETLEQLSTRLQNGAMSFRMVPISNLLDRFPPQLRDLARPLGKKIHVSIVGGETELDKVLINRMADPLMHMLRNAIDHGIESPEERRAAGKPETGQITLRTYYHGSHAVIEVADDGRGVNLARVEAKGRERGLVPAERSGDLTEAEVLNLLFLPGFSTNDQVTELSGRGVGMDVVKNAIQALQGTIEIHSEPGQGTRFRLQLPLTLAIVKILLVQESSHQFALPILNIEALITVKRKDLQTVGGHLVYNHLGHTLTVTSLSALLDFRASPFRQERVPLVILNENGRLTGLLVDSVLGRQEILIKNLGRFLRKVPFVMGCTILRDSRLVQILDPRQLTEAVRQAASPSLSEVQVSGNPESRPRALIVDDSPIQRENLRNILRDSGYEPDTAENGFDALKACRSRRYGALFVDIIMPLMDGYEFVKRLRKLAAYTSTPVFLISSKAVEETRIAGLQVSRVFRKPVDPQTLVEALNSAAAQGAAP